MDTARSVAFGTLLRRHRVAAGLTQEELAERALISKRSIGDMERGVPHTPRRDTVALLADALAFTAEQRAAFVQAAQRLGTPSPARAAPEEPSTPPFVGRAGELDLLERHLGGEGPPVLLLAGEPGIGKTRLLHAAAPRAIGYGLCVLEGGCQRRGGHAPFAPLLGALQRHLRAQRPARLRAALRGCAWLVRLLPELADGPIEPLPAWTLSPEQERRLMVEAVARVLSNVAGPAGTLLLLDDLQWADPDALDLLATLARAAPEIPLRIVGAYRDTEVQAHDPLAVMLADLAQAGLAARRLMGPLAPAEAARLLDSLLEGLDDLDDVKGPAGAGAGFRERVLERAGGMPFFVVSWAQTLRLGAVAEASAQGEGDGPRGGIPWDLAQGLRQRVAALPEPAREALGVAAVAGREAPRALLATVTGWPERAVLDALEAACRARLLEEAGPRAYRFAHDVIREVVEADLSAGRRMLLHGAIAAALETEAAPGAPPADLLAYHYARGGISDKAVHYLEQAGDHARARYAHAAAEGYYRELVERLEPLGRVLDAARAREKLGTLLDTLAQYDAALALLERAAGVYQAAGELEGLQRTLAAIGQVHAHRGTPEEGLRRLRPLLDPPAPADPSALNAMPPAPGPGLVALHLALARLYMFSGQYVEQLAAAELATDLARGLEQTPLLAQALYERSFALSELGCGGEALPLVEQAIRLAEAEGQLGLLCYALDLAGGEYEDKGEFARARQYNERALTAAQQQGDPSLIAYLLTRRGVSAFRMGEWVQARRDYTQAVALVRQIGASWAAALPLHDLGRLCLAEGARAEATAYLEESCALAKQTGNLNPLREAQLILAERDILAGHAEAACARLQPLLDRPGLREGQVVFLLPTLAWAHLEAGDADQAAALVEQVVQRARAGRHLRALVEALRVQALVCTRQHHWVEAVNSLEEGLSLTRGMPYPYAEARFLHAYGLLDAARGEPVSAREWLEQALALFQRLGASGDSERVAHELMDLAAPA